MIKKILLFSLLTNFVLLSQQATEDSFLHNDLDRSYVLYVPESYDPNSPTSLVLNLHGYSSNAGQQMIYSNFYTLSDADGFILVHPQGTIDENGFAFWNSGLLGESIEIDDVGFLSNLIDTISSQYSINPDKIYSTGMSNGGFMSYKLACELSDKIAAVASVTGSMNESQLSSCFPQQSIPVMQIHGTTDLVVLYDGNEFLETLPIEDVVSYWVAFNECDMDPVVTNMPDINIVDLSQAEHYLYDNGLNGASVEFYKIINGGHTWPGALIPLTGNNTNQDINASEKIWEFFKKYDINGLVNPNSNILEQESINKQLIKRFDVLGRNCMHANMYIDIFNDGSIDKKILID